MSWLKNILLPVRFFLGAIEQTRDDRISFRNGFTSSQVLDADGKSVLTFDTEVGAATTTPDANKVVKRNGSGAIQGTTFVGNAFNYATPQIITRDEPIAPDISNVHPVNGWGLEDFEPVTNAVGTSQSTGWRTQINPPVGSVLQSIAARYTPPSGHVSLPDQPGILLLIIDENGVGLPHETPVQDNAASVSAYEAGPRTITKTFTNSVSIEANKRYIVVFYNEGDVQALPGLRLHRPARWTIATTSP